MNKTRIEYADFSWNPIKGFCPIGCWYCYARKIYQRFKLDPEPWLDVAELNMTVKTRRTGKRVFICSTFELFHSAADGRWRDLIFDVIRRRPDLTFIILTKMPERIDRPMPDNVWLGVSVTGVDDWDDRVRLLENVKAKIKFVSLEPFLGKTPFFMLNRRFDWLIIGRLTGHGNKHDPAQIEIWNMINQARELAIPVFLKNNLREIWGAPLIQEFPK